MGSFSHNDLMMLPMPDAALRMNFFPSFLGRPTTLDFAVTAPQRLHALGSSGNTSAAEAYGAYKRRHLGQPMHVHPNT